jgi:hypothetical protein
LRHEGHPSKTDQKDGIDENLNKILFLMNINTVLEFSIHLRPVDALEHFYG